HPLFSSAVDYVAGRSSVLCATFYFAAALFFLWAFNCRRRTAQAIYFALTALMGFLAWQAKEEAITLPLFLAGLVFLRNDKKQWWRIATLLAVPLPILILMRNQLASLYAVTSKNQLLVAAGFDQVLPPPIYIRTYLTSVIAYYLPRFVVPLGLSADP